eukprot:scaffold65650_cov33-Tisochrysis_lutea.AAC.1
MYLRPRSWRVLSNGLVNTSPTPPAPPLPIAKGGTPSVLHGRAQKTSEDSGNVLLGLLGTHRTHSADSRRRLYPKHSRLTL